MKNIKVLDCTLRDGVNVNNWNFGEKNIELIIKSLSKSNVEIIELGHLKNDIKNNDLTLADNIDYFNYIGEKYLLNIETLCTVMTRPDLFDIKNIPIKKNNQKVNGLRFAFYPYHKKELKEQVNIAKEKGYEIYLNPIGISCYSIEEIKYIIDFLNKLRPKCISIVDSFGALDFISLSKIQKVFNSELDQNIVLGIHLHENMGISFALACQFINENKNNRDIIIDSSLQGIGRVPGNLCSEVIMSQLNFSEDKKYNLSPILEVIDEVINPIRKKIAWGYMPHYYLSALANVNRNYAEYFYETKGINLRELPHLFQDVKKFDPSGLRFSKEICEQILEIKK